MIAAAADALRPTQEVERLNLDLKELEVIKDTFLNIATQAALIAGPSFLQSILLFTATAWIHIPAYCFASTTGFAFTGITELDLPDTTPVGFRICFYLAITAVLACELHVIVIATVCCTGGPNVAMRGSDKARALKRAVKGMKQGQTQLYNAFGLGLLCFELASILICFAKVWYGLLDKYIDGQKSYHEWGIAVVVILSVQMGYSTIQWLLYSNRYFHLDANAADKWRWVDVFGICCRGDRNQRMQPAASINSAAGSRQQQYGSFAERAGNTTTAAGGGGGGSNGRSGQQQTDELTPSFQCPHCGVDVGIDHKFCFNCQAAL